MAMEWSNEKVIAFLEILQTEPCLWDKRNTKHKSFKNRGTQSDAWRRIMELLPSQATIEEIKKKKESQIGYRTHLNTIKQSMKSGVGKDDVYTTNWFAFETMDNFRRGVYDSSRTLNTETHDDYEAQERSVEGNDENQKSPLLSTETEEASQNIQEKNGTLPRESKSSQNYGKKRQVRDELHQEIKAARRQMDEAYEFMKEKKDDKCEMFGRLIASKLKKKIGNPNTRDILMNDIHNLVFRARMADRLEQQSAVPKFSTSQSPHHQAFSQSPNPSTYQSPPGHSTSQSPHHQAFSPSPNHPIYQWPLSQDTNCPPPDKFSVQTPQENFVELPLPTRASQIVITESGETKIIND